jgi:hypothetical protein
MATKRQPAKSARTPTTKSARKPTTKGKPDLIERVREICLSFPEAAEKPFGGHTAPSFRVRDKLFMMSSEDGMHLTCKAPLGAQHALVTSDPDLFFVPQYVGSKGWVGIHVEQITDWDEIAEIAEESYRMTAPKRVAALLPPRYERPSSS